MSATTADPFTRSVTLVLDLEGADTDNIATDPDGGLTRFGISSKQHPEVDVAGLTRDAALAWYRQNVWDAHRCGEMAWPVCLVVFDEAVWRWSYVVGVVGGCDGWCGGWCDGWV